MKVKAFSSQAYWFLVVKKGIYPVYSPCMLCSLLSPGKLGGLRFQFNASGVAPKLGSI